MAGPLSPGARSQSLQNDYAETPPARPSGFLAAIYDGDPEFGGEELTDADCPGYARVPVAYTDFTVVDEGIEAVVTGFEATAAWTKVGRVVLLLNADDPSEGWDYSFIATLRVRAAGPLDPLQFTVYYSDDSTDPT